ncbi:enoyl-CoA hydratase/isomerase family protein [Halomarina salina]|uniref:Enoyl-CoA hydratase/isomerase family protein n=1 Tax=Halomarina salina TaxID=1872699 RepID=A0ABD5RU84_9EURY|nr:enoyl-CoA hydratase/isomerase family protein [Halomarina salina]
MESTEYDNLVVRRDGSVVHVTMESQSQFNALNTEMASELADVATMLAEDDETRCLTLTGSDEVYCPGADLSQFTGDESDAAALRAEASELHRALIHLHQAELPIVGAINGTAAGAGFSLALFPDIVVMSEDARLEFAYPRIGLTGDGGSTFMLPRIVGLRQAMEIILMDEPIYPERAVELGLATEVVESEDLNQRTEEIAAKLAEGPTHAIGKTKRLVHESFDRAFADQLAAETEAISSATRTTDYERGFAAFGTDEEPEFTGR